MQQNLCEITGSLYLISCPAKHHASDREMTKCEMPEWLWNSLWWKRKRLPHCMLSFVMSSLPLCLYALLFPAASYKTGSTLIVDLNKIRQLPFLPCSCTAVIESRLNQQSEFFWSNFCPGLLAADRVIFVESSTSIFSGKQTMNKRNLHRLFLTSTCLITALQT